MEMKNAVNSQCVIWFMQEIYYVWLTSTVLWMDCSNLHLIWNNKMISLLYKSFADMLQILSSFKILLFYIFFVKIQDNQVWKLQHMVEPKRWNLVLALCSVFNPYPGCTAVIMAIITDSLLGNRIYTKCNLMQREYQYL